MKKVLSLILVILLLFICSTVSFAADKSVNGCNWMSMIDDKTSLADISMPGTHDTAANWVAFGIKARTQNKTIPEQLNCGARFFDIRLANEKGKLKLVHSIISCRKGSGFSAPKLYFEDVAAYCSTFLQNNPQECICLFIKRDSGSAEGFDELLLESIAASSGAWFTENRIPTLGEVRGKIVLLNRFSEAQTALTDQNGGINLTNFPYHGANEGAFETVRLYSFSGKTLGEYTVQDRYKYPRKDKWSLGVVPTFDYDKPQGELLINFLSTASGISPEVNAKYVNAQLVGYDLDESRCYGAVLFDFIDDTLAKKIYSCNTAVIDNECTPAIANPSEVPEPKHGLFRFLDSLWAKLVEDFSKVD